MFEKEELNEFVSKVRESSDIFNVVSRYVSLKRKGNEYWGCCPFHSEKTPSFKVSPEKGFFYCFGCHVGGNVFKFLSMAENINYFEAVKLQAERLGIPLPSSKENKSPEQIKREQDEKSLINVNTLAKDFFHSCLINTPYGEVGRKYLESRGISKEIIEDFELGFSPDSWDSLSKALISKKNQTPELLIMAGLVSPKKSGGVYDKFRNRIIIPIADLYGRIVAFGGRILEEKKPSNSSDYVEPKYLNSPETLVFNKKNLLFGLNRATQEIIKSNYVIVVEGYMDAISVASAGIKNVVASLGTAFTEEQAKLLLRYTKKIFFCYDSDEAGQKATLRALSIVLNAGAEVKIILIPDGKDPDEYIRKHGIEEFKKLISKAAGLVDYRINYVLSHTEHTSLEGKVNALRQILPIIIEIKDMAMKTEYCKRVSAMLLIEYDAVIAEMRKLSDKQNFSQQQMPVIKNESKIKKLQVEDRAIPVAERIILKMAWHETGMLQYALSFFPKRVFTKVHQEIIDYLNRCIELERSPDDITAEEELSSEAMAEVSKFLLENENISEEEKIQAYKDSIQTVKIGWIKLKYVELVEEIKKISAEDVDYTNNPEYKEKMEKCLKIKKELDLVKN